MPDCVAVWALRNLWWTWRGWSCQSCQQVSSVSFMHDYACHWFIHILVNSNETTLLFKFFCFNILIWICKTDVFFLLTSRILPENVANILSHPDTKERVLSSSDASDVLRYAFTLTEAAIDHQYEVRPISWCLKCFFSTRFMCLQGCDIYVFELALYISVVKKLAVLVMPTIQVTIHETVSCC